MYIKTSFNDVLYKVQQDLQGVLTGKDVSLTSVNKKLFQNMTSKSSELTLTSSGGIMVNPVLHMYSMYRLSFVS
jgi:hypothetical protein